MEPPGTTRPVSPECPVYCAHQLGLDGSFEWRKSQVVTEIRAVPECSDPKSVHHMPMSGDTGVESYAKLRLFDRQGRAINEARMSGSLRYELLHRCHKQRRERDRRDHVAGVDQWHGDEKPPLIFSTRISYDATKPAVLTENEYLASTEVGAIRQHSAVVRRLRQAAMALTQPVGRR